MNKTVDETHDRNSPLEVYVNAPVQPTASPLVRRCSGEDPLLDYCLVPYRPARPAQGKLHSSCLLASMAPQLGLGGALDGLAQAIVDRIGRDKTVWAVKKFGDAYSLELYFYNYGREDPDVTPSNLLDVVRPYFTHRGLERCDRMRYMMFSLDVTPAMLERGELDGLHVYVHAVADRPTGLSYFVTGSGVRLENHYAFYDPSKDPEQLVVNVVDSVAVDFTAVRPADVLLPELVSCNRICVAKKPATDSLYFSGIGVEQFEWFLRRFDYPTTLRQYVEANRPQLDHLRLDVAIDYSTVDGELVIGKSIFCGTF